MNLNTLDSCEFLAMRTLTCLKNDMKRMYRHKESPTIADGLNYLNRKTDDAIFSLLCSVGSSVQSADSDFIKLEFARRCLREVKNDS